MKRLFSLTLTICMVMTLASCGNGSEPTSIELVPPIVSPMEIEQQEEVTHQEEIPEASDAPFEGKIAIITETFHHGFIPLNVLPIIDKYGEERIIHRRWPLQIVIEQEVGIRIIEELSNDSDVQVIIANPWKLFSVEALERLREEREDVLLVLCIYSIIELEESLIEAADLILVLDEISTGPAMVRQAYKMGAETFVLYSFEPRGWPSELVDIARRDLIKQKCTELDIRFIEIITPASLRYNTDDRRNFIREGMQRIFQSYGQNTAVFGALLTSDLLPIVIEFEGIFPQPRNLGESPFNGFSHCFGIFSDFSYEDLIDPHLAAEKYIDFTRTFLDEHNMLGRVSNWPVPYSFLFTHAATEYAIKRLNGEVPKDGIDVDVLRKIMEEYAGVNVYLTPFTDLETGVTHEHVLMMRMGYFIY